jgi:hypothetical protein
MKGEKILHLSPTVSHPNPKYVFIAASHFSLPSLLSPLTFAPSCSCELADDDLESNFNYTNAVMDA